MQRQLRLLGIEPGWDLPGLTNWIDRQIRHPDIIRTQSTLFIRRAIEGLLESRGLSVEQLAQQKFRLKNSLAEKISNHRRARAKQSFQQVLLESRSRAIISGRMTT
ncbi:MAG: hypothetical protein KDA75_16485, partial [Planctomycetaceae bacterium]|nr:hypothetical protein [Planctomycetaceae bacterium]